MVARQPERGEQALHLGDAQNGREGTALGRANELKGGPGALQGMDKQELDGRQGDGDGAGGDAFLVDEIEEIVEAWS